MPLPEYLTHHVNNLWPLFCLFPIPWHPDYALWSPWSSWMPSKALQETGTWHSLFSRACCSLFIGVSLKIVVYKRVHLENHSSLLPTVASQITFCWLESKSCTFLVSTSHSHWGVPAGSLESLWMLMSLEWGANLKSSQSRACFRFLFFYFTGWGLWWVFLTVDVRNLSPSLLAFNSVSLVSPKTGPHTSLHRCLRGHVLGHLYCLGQHTASHC